MRKFEKEAMAYYPKFEKGLMTIPEIAKEIGCPYHHVYNCYRDIPLIAINRFKISCEGNKTFTVSEDSTYFERDIYTRGRNRSQYAPREYKKLKPHKIEERGSKVICYYKSQV